MRLHAFLLCAWLAASLSSSPSDARKRLLTTKRFRNRNAQKKMQIQDLKKQFWNLVNPNGLGAMDEGSCEPENRTIMLFDKNEVKKGVIYFPSCVTVHQCAGCCPGMKKCTPTSFTERIEKVLEVKASSYKSITKEAIRDARIIHKIVKVHDICECRCHFCRTAKHETDMDCNCFCKNRRERERCLAMESSNMEWNNTLCQCQCRRTPCSSWQVFDEESCECVNRTD